MSIGGGKRETTPTPCAAKYARKGSQYISCAIEVVKFLHLPYMSAQRGDCIYKLPVCAACFFFIHIFVSRISKTDCAGTHGHRLSRLQNTNETRVWCAIRDCQKRLHSNWWVAIGRSGYINVVFAASLLFIYTLVMRRSKKNEFDGWWRPSFPSSERHWI